MKNPRVSADRRHQSSKLLSLALFVAASLATSRASPPPESPAGLAWAVKGAWYVGSQSAPVHTGDSIQPSDLLKPTRTTEAHSITLLMADGQRVLYECFKPEDCARGFRAPKLTAQPSDPTIRMLKVIQRGIPFALAASPHGPPLPRDEFVSLLDTDIRAKLTGLIDKLPAGRYTCLVRDNINPRHSPYTAAFSKTSSPVSVALPGPGLYTLLVRDAQGTPRMDLMMLAVRSSDSSLVADFAHVRSQLSSWNEQFDGWPVDDLLRAYLAARAPSQPVEHNAQIVAP